MMVAWNFIYVLLTLPLLFPVPKGGFQMEIDGELEAQAVCTDTRCKTVIDLHRDRVTVGFYLLSITLRILVEAWFVCSASMEPTRI